MMKITGDKQMKKLYGRPVIEKIGKYYICQGLYSIAITNGHGKLITLKDTVRAARMCVNKWIKLEAA